MRLLEPGDYVIWKGQSVCKILQSHKAHTFLSPDTGLGIQPAGITVDEYAEIKNFTTRWVIQDEDTGMVFIAEGADLLYVNEMQLIAIMAASAEKKKEQNG
jgi:hypothetical protein